MHQGRRPLRQLSSLPSCLTLPPPVQPDDYEAVFFKNPFLAGLRSLLPRWLGGRKAS